MSKKTKIASTASLLAFAFLAGGLTVAAPAQAAAQVTNPCAKLTAGQVKYSGFGAKRVTFATTTVRNTSSALVTSCVRSGNTYSQEWQVKGTVGTNGFKAPGVASGHTRYEYSPTGSYSVTEGFGLWNPGTALAFRVLNKNSRWGGGGQYASNYNKYFESTRTVWPDENMWDFAMRGDYRQGVVLNYNRPPDSPIKSGAGFAIFLHANPIPTAGCIALPEHMVTRFLKTATPGDRVIMGAVDDIFTPHKNNPFGPVMTKYAKAGGQVTLGNPVASQVYGQRDGGSYQNYAKGRVIWSKATGARMMTNGAIKTTWEKFGAQNGTLGYPTGDKVGGLINGGYYQMFQKGAILYSPASGARISQGPIRTAWAKTGYERGKLGYPITNIYKNAAGVSIQDYQRGTITWTSAAGAKVHYR